MKTTYIILGISAVGIGYLLYKRSQEGQQVNPDGSEASLIPESTTGMVKELLSPFISSGGGGGSSNPTIPIINNPGEPKVQPITSVTPVPQPAPVYVAPVPQPEPYVAPVRTPEPVYVAPIQQISEPVSIKTISKQLVMQEMQGLSGFKFY